MTDRNDILQRTLNLRSLAESTASEAEAMNAMRIADKLMHAYRIEEAELALAEGLGEIKVEIVNETKFNGSLKVGRVRHKVQNSIWSLERYCEVEVVLKNRFGDDGLNVIGDRPDVDLFWYLLEIIRTSMDREYNNWKRKQQAVGRGAKASFQLAMGYRINQRLREMGDERTKEREEAVAEGAKLLNMSEGAVRMAVSNGNIGAIRSSMSLVVASAAEQKRVAVNEAYAAAYRGVRLGTASGFSYRGGSSAAQAGRSAGDKVNFNRPVGGNTPQGRLN